MELAKACLKLLLIGNETNKASKNKTEDWITRDNVEEVIPNNSGIIAVIQIYVENRLIISTIFLYGTNPP